MAYRSTYAFCVRICSETLPQLRASFPCVDFTKTDKLHFVNDTKELSLALAMKRKTDSSITINSNGEPELRIFANFVATYELIDRIDFFCSRIPEEFFGLLTIGEHYEDYTQLGLIPVGRIARSIIPPSDWCVSQTFDQDD